MPHGPAARRTVAVLALVCGVAAVAGACTRDDAAPVPSLSRSADPPVVPVTAVPAPSSSVPTEPSPGVVSVATPALTCVPADDDLDLTSLKRFGALRADLTPADLVTVEVGPGDDPGETWWIVATASHSDAWGSEGADTPLTFLSTAPSGGDTWINVSRALQAPVGSTDWSRVSWTGEKLARGQQAQALAISCLDAPP